MNQGRLLKALADLPLGGVRYLERVGSTNDEAAGWAEQGAPDLALVVVEEQTSGRGRLGRSWITVPRASLAFSLVMFPAETEASTLGRLSALGALAVRNALQQYYGLPAQIKWPNDVLVHRQKLAGILAEAQWVGDQLGAVILGIGINIAAASVSPRLRGEGGFHFPATCVEDILGRPVDRYGLLHDVLAELIHWRLRVSSLAFLRTWDASLAFRGERVKVNMGHDELPGDLDRRPAPPLEGVLVGLAPDGSLKLQVQSGEVVAVQAGEVRLRPYEALPL